MTNLTLPRAIRSVTVHPTDPLTTTIDIVALPDPIPPNHMLVKVHAAASNPKDWSLLTAPLNSGDDLAGTIAAIGANVSNFKTGDRVGAFHQMGSPYGAYAEYALAPTHTTFKIPEAMGFEEASTIPLVILTAALSLFRRQGFESPWSGMTEKNKDKPLVIYAASSALGVFIIKLAKLAGIGPIVAIGGRSSGYMKTFLRQDDVFVDYRLGMERVKEEVKRALNSKGLTAHSAFDIVSERGSWVDVSQMIDGGKLSVFSGANKYEEDAVAPGVEIIYTFVGSGHLGAYYPGMPKQPVAQEVPGDVEFAKQFFQWTAEMLQSGKLEGHPLEVVPRGLQGVLEGLKKLKAGKAAGKKFVYRISP